MFNRLFLTVFLFALWLPAPLTARQGLVSAEEKAEATERFIEGITHFENKEYEQALRHLTVAHLKLSESAGVNFALADVYFAMGDLSNAAYYGQIAVNLDPENKWYHLKLADIYRKEGRNEAVIEAYENALNHHPNDSDILYRLAEAHVDFGELLKANEVYDRILAIRGGDFDLHLRKFQNFNALQMRDSALVQLKKMRDLNPGNLTTLHTLSQYYLGLDDEEAARNILEEARERNSRNPQTVILLAEIYIQNSEWDQVGRAFTAMLEDPLIYPSQKRELVRFMLQQYQHHPDEPLLEEQTRLIVKRFSEIEPEYGPAQLIAAEFYTKTGESELALEKLEQANRVVPEERDAWRQRFQLLFAMEKYQQVINLSGSAESQVSDDAIIQFFTGASYMLTGRPAEAEIWLDRATLSPARREFRSVVYGAVGDVKQELDKVDEAIQAYERAIRLDASNHNAMNNYAYFLAEQEQQLDKALKLAEQAVSQQPENASYLDTLGWIYFKSGNLIQAEQYLQIAIKTGVAGAEIFEHLGDVYHEMGETENAKIWWKRAFEEDPGRTHLQEKL